MMKITAMILCMCILQHIPYGASRTHRSKANLPTKQVSISRRLQFRDLRKPLDTVVGSLVLNPTLHVLEKVANVNQIIAQFGTNAVKSILSKVGLAITKIKEHAKTIEIPGWGYVMYFPNQFLTIIDKGSKGVLTIKNLGKNLIRASEAFTIYHTLNIVSSTIGGAMRLIGKDCISVKPKSLDVKNPVVSRIELSTMKICGLSHFRPQNIVKVGDSPKHFFIMRVSYVLESLTAKVDRASVFGLGIELLENIPMLVSMKRVFLDGQVEFRSRSIMELAKLRLRVAGFEGFKLKILEKRDRTQMMDIIEGVSPFVALEVKKQMNRKFVKMEQGMTLEIFRKIRKLTLGARKAFVKG